MIRHSNLYDFIVNTVTLHTELRCCRCGPLWYTIWLQIMESGLDN